LAYLVRFRTLATACGCAVALALAGATARADGTDPAYPGSVLHVTTAGPQVAGQVLTIVASGGNAPFGTPIDYGLRLFAIDHAQLPIPCAQSFSLEETIWENNPQAGALLTFENLNEGLSGPFDISLPITLGGPGDLLICAYTVLVTDDAAWASDELTIAPGGTEQPVVTTRPRITRSGNRLVCSHGVWAGKPASFAYRWREVHKPGAVGRRASLTVTGRLRGHTVQCAVTAKNSAGSATATSRRFKIT
jgi:hypothetical protein